jgi:hypothetical protein
MPRIFNKKNTPIIIFLIFSLHFSEFFLNFFKLYKYNFTQRMIMVYGDCGQESYGFINRISKENKFYKNIVILHPNPNFSFNNSNWYNYKINKKYYDDRLILINENNNLTKINNKEYSLIFKGTNLGQYKIIEQQYNCYYLKKS